MPAYSIYIIYTSLLALVLLAVVPRSGIKRLAFYGIVFGGVADVLIIIILSLSPFDVGGYQNYGPFGFKGVPFFPPLAWSIWYILYFYFLPQRRLFRYIFILTSASYSVIFSNILSNLGIFKWNYGEILVPFMIYITWMSGATWMQGKMDRQGYGWHLLDREKMRPRLRRGWK